jgi:hypothetical protein
MHDLTSPEVLRCFFADSPPTPLLAMALHWHDEQPADSERIWHLPAGVCIRGAAPTRFGVTVHRHDVDAYHVRLLWDNVCLSWQHLTRVQIIASALTPILALLGTDLWYLLAQPLPAQEARHAAARAA